MERENLEYTPEVFDTSVKQERGKKSYIIFIIIVAVVAVLLVGAGVFMSKHYPMGREIETPMGNVEIGLKTTEKVTDELTDKLNTISYTLVLSTNDTVSVPISEVSAGVEKEKVRGILEGYNTFGMWFKAEPISVNLNDCVEFERDSVARIIQGINDVNAENIVEPSNAYIAYNEESKEFEIKPEVYGNILIDETTDRVLEQFKACNIENNLSLLDCYPVPEILANNEDLVSALGVFNELKGFELVYNFGDTPESLNIDTINSWVSPNFVEGAVLDIETPFIVSEDAVNEYVLGLNRKYTTIGTSRPFTNAYGTSMTVSGGDYGWILNRGAMKDSIVEHIQHRQSETLDGIFSQTGAILGSKDFGNSYVEVSIANQRLWMYVNGECIVNTPVVTGDVTKSGRSTTKGVYSLTYKTTNTVLKGPGYASPVSYWMPFNEGQGLHDATWRGSFGGSIYRGNGSHGCVNMPLSAARTVYNNINSSMPIIIW